MNTGVSALFIIRKKVIVAGMFEIDENDSVWDEDIEILGQLPADTKFKEEIGVRDDSL